MLLAAMGRIHALLFAALLVSSCREDVGPAVQQLEQAATAEQEAAAFEALKDKANVLGFVAYDEHGTKLPGQEAPWDGRATRITLRINGEVVEHELISSDNIPILID